MRLEQQIQILRKEVAEFREALDLLKNPPERYGPKPGEIPLLDYLKLEMAVLRQEEEREKLLEISQQTLTAAEKRLAAKEEELSQLQLDCEAIASEMAAAGELVLGAQLAYREALEKFQQMASKHRPRWQELNPNSELYQQLAAVEFPAFVMRSSCGTLTTTAIARDLR